MANDNVAQITLSAVDKTKAAFDTARRNLESFESSAKSLAPALAGAFSIVGIETFLRGTLTGITALNDLKDASGSSVENLSALEDIAARTGTSFDTVGTALTKFNKVLTEAEPNSGVAQLLKNIGLNAEELKRIDPAEALLKTAVAFEGYADDGNKARNIQVLFGKSVQEVAPFLHNLAEAGRLNATVTTDQAKAAETFNRHLFTMQKNATDAGRALVIDLLPALETLTRRSAETANGFTLMSVASGGIKTVVETVAVLAANLEFVFGGVGREIGAIAAQSVALAHLDFKGFTAIGDAVKADGARARAELDAVEKKILGIGQVKVASATDDRPGGPPPPPKGGGDAAAAALATLKKNLDGSLQAIQQNLQNEQDLLKFNETFTQTVYNNGNTSLATFYQVQDALRQRNLDEQKQALNNSIANELAYQAKLPKDSTGDAARAESANKVAAARAKIVAAEREAQQAADLSKVERPAALAAQQRQLDAFNATLQDMVDGGRTRAAELADIANRVEAARKTLVQGGADDATVKAQTDALRAQLTLQHDFNVARDALTTVTDRASAAEEALQLVQRSSGVGLLEGEQQIHALREQELAQLGKLLDTTRALANVNPQNEALQKGLRDLELAYGRLKEAADPTKLRLDGAADNIGDALANGLSRANTEGKNLKQILGGIGTQIADIVEREVITKPLSQSIANFVKGSGGQGAGENLIGKLFGLNSPKSAAIAADPTTQLTASLSALQATGVDPATEALTRLQQAADGAAGALGGATQGTPGFGPAGGFDFGGANAAGEQSIKDLFKNVDDAQAGASKSADATGLALERLAVSASQGGSALSLLPQLISLIGSAATVGGAGGGVGGLFGSITGLFSQTSLGGSGFGSGLAYGNADLGLSFHEGGVVGAGGKPIEIDPAAFRFAARYHGGGVAGLKPDEVPAILQRGEEVLRRSDARHRDNSGMSRSGDTYFDLRGLTVDSKGQMDRMAEDRAARNIAMKAQKYLSRRGA